MARRSPNNKAYNDVIGVIPAAGQANRIGPLPCSKEIYPVGFHKIAESGEFRPKAVSQYLLEKMRLAGVRRCFIILREGKWDIPKYYGSGAMLDMDLAYLMMGVPFGTPYTVDQAYPFVRQKLVVFGFPDILFEGNDALTRLIQRQASTEADVVLGLFRVSEPSTMDMVEVVKDGAVRSIILKPAVTNLRWGWIIAVWTPVFTEFLHEHLTQSLKGRSASANVNEKPELSVGHVFQAALRHGLKLQSVRFPEQAYLDIGTPDNLIKAVCELSARFCRDR